MRTKVYLRMNKTGQRLALTTGNAENQMNAAYHIICWKCMGVDYTNSMDWVDSFMMTHKHKDSVRVYRLQDVDND